MSLPFWLGEPRYQVWDVHCTTILAIYTALLHTNHSSNTYPKPLPYEIFIGGGTNKNLHAHHFGTICVGAPPGQHENLISRPKPFLI